jgi:hypothetical protein
LKLFFILFALFFLSLGGCDNDRYASSDAGTSNLDEEPDPGDDSPTDQGICTRLFGIPSSKTGLDENQCAPSCNCGEMAYNPTEYTQEALANMAARQLLNPPELLESDPYQTPEQFAEEPNRVCAVIIEPSDPTTYRLQTFADEVAAEAAGAIVTHHGACGLCSSLANLVVYIRNTDLTEPVRDCSLKGMTGSMEDSIKCLQEIGFDLPCAQIWYYNIVSTRTQCLSECISALDLPYQQPDGTPNDCILCDEDKSGPVFKTVSGRTRRNSGLPTALCRPCETITPILHKY